nr:VWA domain-containing protein [uncultured Holophaga sp.]
MSPASFVQPLFLVPAGVLAVLALAFGIRAHLRPGLGVRVVAQRPLLQGLGLALVLAGLGVGLAGPRGGSVEVPRLTVHVVVDASRSMLAPVSGESGAPSRWEAARRILERLWSRPNPEVRFSLDILTGDAVPLLPPGEDQALLRDVLGTVSPGELGSQGTSLGRGLPMVAAQAEPRTPAVILLLGDGEETWEKREEALQRAKAALAKARLPLFALPLGGTEARQVPGSKPGEPSETRPDPEFLKQLAEATGGQLLAPGDDLAARFQRLARGQDPLPAARSLMPTHPEWGAWVALAGLVLWLLGAGRPLKAWRTPLLVLAGFLASQPGHAAMPQGVKVWMAQRALDRGDLDTARRWRPRGDRPLDRLVAAEVDLRSGQAQAALEVLNPLLGQGAPTPPPVWRAPALLMAARAQVALGHRGEAQGLLERLLKEQPGRSEAVQNLQTLLKDQTPPPPDPKKPPPPPPIRPSQGAQEDELEGIRQRLPKRPDPQGGVRDL